MPVCCGIAAIISDTYDTQGTDCIHNCVLLLFMSERMGGSSSGGCPWTSQNGIFFCFEQIKPSDSGHTDFPGAPSPLVEFISPKDLQWENFQPQWKLMFFLFVVLLGIQLKAMYMLRQAYSPRATQLSLKRPLLPVLWILMFTREREKDLLSWVGLSFSTLSLGQMHCS